MPAVGLTLFLAACWSARSLHISDSQPKSQWRTELQNLAEGVRVACGAGDFITCTKTTQTLQDHVWDQLKNEAIKLELQVSDMNKSALHKSALAPADGDGLHVHFPACVNGSGKQDGPEFFYRHVPKIAGFNILMNMHRFAGEIENTDRNFPSPYYNLLNDSKAQYPNSTFAFTFARNPLTRFVSGYTELEVSNQTLLENFTNFTRGTRERALEFIKAVLRHGFHNYHIFPQVRFHLAHYANARSPFDFIGRVEHFANGWQHLENMSNCSGKLGPWKYNVGGHFSHRDPYRTTVAMKDVVKDPHPSAWYTLNIDPHMGFEDAINMYTNTTQTSKVHKDSLAMRELLLSSDGIALRVVCLLLLPDFYILSYPLPSGCKDLNVE